MHIDLTLDTHQSAYRERLLEHLLIGDLLKYSWLHAGATLEVSQPSIDRSGHDAVLEANGVTRHLQLSPHHTPPERPPRMYTLAWLRSRPGASYGHALTGLR
jgi:hypothetical protein